LPSIGSPALIFLLSLICLLFIFPYNETVQRFDLPKIGVASKETIIAPFTFDIIRSPDELERERKRAMDRVLLFMDFDSGVSLAASRKIASLQAEFAVSDDTPDSLKTAMSKVPPKELSHRSVETLRRRPALFDKASEQLSLVMDSGVASVLLFGSNEELNELRSKFNAQFSSNFHYTKKFVTLMRGGEEKNVAVSDIPVREVALEQVAARLKREQMLDDEALNAIYELLYACVQPNIRVNNTLTQERKRAAAAEVLETSGKVIMDTEIVRKHQEVTAEVIQKLHSLHIAMDRLGNQVEKRRVDAGNAGQLLLVLIPLLFFAFYVHKFQPGLAKNPKNLAALCLIVLLQILIIRLVMDFFPSLLEGREVSAAMPEYLVPITMASVLCVILFGLQVSMFVGLFISIYFGIITGFNQFFFLYAFLNSIVAAFLNYKIRYRWHFFKAIPPMFITSVVTVAIWQLTGWHFETFFVNVGYVFGGVLLSVFLTMMLNPFFERIFDLTTDMTLVELSDMNHPILKRLSIEAAGTYNHSVLVGNLAESAAQAVGANTLLARVASYYHDIGKIDKPDYFVENCIGDRNRHNKLSPSMSALIICSHVKEGVDLARKYRLPKIIRDVILQHHGNSSVSFFYEKALEQDPHKQVQEKDFQYPGPTPQTREAAIIMLADSVEAASRSLASSSPKLLRELVKKIIRDKFLSGQLDECNLTLRDLHEITDGFMPVLQGIFHTRIEYPNK
jgi:putative nucleotidyltransferase with HDIG domain